MMENALSPRKQMCVCVLEGGKGGTDRGLAPDCNLFHHQGTIKYSGRLTVDGFYLFKAEILCCFLSDGENKVVLSFKFNCKI